MIFETASEKKREMLELVNRNSKFDKYMYNLRITYIYRE